MSNITAIVHKGIIEGGCRWGSKRRALAQKGITVMLLINLLQKDSVCKTFIGQILPLPY